MNERGKLLNEGKTKKIWETLGKDDLVIIQNKEDITAFDDPKFTKQFSGKAKYATNTTCCVFELLKQAGIPVAYRQQLSSTEFLAEKCEMIPLEVVARRFAVGSYLKRHPELTQPEGQVPHRFHRLMVEFFLKTTGGKLIIGSSDAADVYDLGLDSKKGEEDPFITNPNGEVWKLFHPKKPSWNPEADLNTVVRAFNVLINYQTRMKKMEDMMRKVFLVLEGAWNSIGLRLIDMKIEFGIAKSGKLVVSDVIDNDSWRLRNADWQELSKEAFRQGEELSKVQTKYSIVSSLVNQIRIPQQALVFWKGSVGDKTPEYFDTIPFVNACEVILSGHKSPRLALQKLDEIVAQYPDGGVIVVMVGRSNGLGPVLAARSDWPIIAIPATAGDFPEDIWSSIRMPSNVPMLTAWPEKNSLIAALNILAQKNPLLYMKRREEIEKLDI